MLSRSAWITVGALALVTVVVAGVLLGRDVFGPAVSTHEGLELTPVVGDDVPDPTSAPTASQAPSTPSTPTDEATAPATEDPTTEPTAEPTEEPSPDQDVAAAQARLRELRYYLGAVDGWAGPATTSAVMAFQKVNGLGVDGVVGPNTLAALASPATPELRGGPATRIEVDLTRQVAYLVTGGQLARIMPVSSGSGDTYTTAGGGTARSLTPVGWFQVERRIVGVREAPLGVLYDPMYVYRGWALHGSNSVPAYPASHGCVRLTRPDARWLAAQVPNGTPVHLYGGTHTFTAGSSAPGTDTPAGDTPTPTPTATPTPTPTPTPTATPTASPSPTPTASPSPTPTASPSPTPTGSTEPTESGTASASPAPTTSASASTSPSPTGSGSTD